MAKPDICTGQCKWFNNQKGYGFLTPDDGSEDIFVHQENILADGYRSLQTGAKVEFTVSTDDQGRVKAVHVTAPGGGPIVAQKERRSPRSGGRGNRDGDDVASPNGRGGGRRFFRGDGRGERRNFRERDGDTPPREMRENEEGGEGGRNRFRPGGGRGGFGGRGRVRGDRGPRHGSNHRRNDNEREDNDNYRGNAANNDRGDKNVNTQIVYDATNDPTPAEAAKLSKKKKKAKTPANGNKPAENAKPDTYEPTPIADNTTN